ncbi:MAG TPA: hemerythrin domain-containing protein [Polyangiaceae bacterium]
MFDSPESRRRLLLGAGALLLTSCAPASGQLSTNAPAQPGAPGPSAPGTGVMAENDEDEDEGGITYAVSPSEDLMREHGVLNRVLLIYEESVRRLDGSDELPSDALVSTIDLTRRFVEDYHARLEEEHLFPRFLQAHKHADLVTILAKQHKVGRQITDQLQSLTGSGAVDKPAGRAKTSALIRAYVRMSRPHEAREDTVLFPAMREIMTADTFSKLYDIFEEREQDELGGDGFSGIVSELTDLERQFGIHELDLFTARV